MPELPQTSACQKPEVTSLDELFRLIRHHQALFVGVGNVLKNDDCAGVYVCNSLQKNSRLECLIVESSLEKYIGKINRIAPEILILVDCMFFPGKNPGYYEFLSVDRVLRYAVHTHNVSLGNIADFFSMPVYILGIHPENVEFGEKLSPSVKESAEEIIRAIDMAVRS